jgi:hypothetical protein
LLSIARSIVGSWDPGRKKREKRRDRKRYGRRERERESEVYSRSFVRRKE